MQQIFFSLYYLLQLGQCFPTLKGNFSSSKTCFGCRNQKLGSLNRSSFKKIRFLVTVTKRPIFSCRFNCLELVS